MKSPHSQPPSFPLFSVPLWTFLLDLLYNLLLSRFICCICIICASATYYLSVPGKEWVNFHSFLHWLLPITFWRPNQTYFYFSHNHKVMATRLLFAIVGYRVCDVHTGNIRRPVSCGDVLDSPPFFGSHFFLSSPFPFINPTPPSSFLPTNSSMFYLFFILVSLPFLSTTDLFRIILCSLLSVWVRRKTKTKTLSLAVFILVKHQCRTVSLALSALLLHPALFLTVYFTEYCPLHCLEITGRPRFDHKTLFNHLWRIKSGNQFQYHNIVLKTMRLVTSLYKHCFCSVWLHLL